MGRSFTGSKFYREYRTFDRNWIYVNGGASEEITMPANQNLDAFGINKDWTLSFTFRLESDLATQYIFNLIDNTTNNYSFTINYNHLTNSITASYEESGTTTSDVISSSEILAGDTVQLVITHSAANQRTYYVNGKQTLQTSSNPRDFYLGDSDLVLFKRAFNDSSRFTGNFSQLYILNSAMTPEEVWDYHQSGAMPDTVLGDIVGHWSFDQLWKTKVLDHVESYNHFRSTRYLINNPGIPTNFSDFNSAFVNVYDKFKNHYALRFIAADNNYLQTTLNTNSLTSITFISEFYLESVVGIKDLVSTTDQHVRVQLSNTDVNVIAFDGVNTSSFTISGQLVTGWNKVAFSFDISDPGNAVSFVNANSSNLQVLAQNPTLSGVKNLYIGRDTSTNYFDGYISYIGIRSGLYTQGELRRSYNLIKIQDATLTEFLFEQIEGDPVENNILSVTSFGYDLNGLIKGGTAWYEHGLNRPLESSLYFNGIDQYLSIANFTPTAESGYSIILGWSTLYDLPLTANDYLLSYRDNGIDFNNSLQINGDGSNNIVIRNRSLTAGSLTTYTSNTHHENINILVYYFRDARELKLFLNGYEYQSDSTAVDTTFDFSDSTSGLNIFGEPDVATQYFEGYLHFFGVTKGRLNQDFINELSKGGQIINPKIATNWEVLLIPDQILFDSTNYYLQDYSGNGNDGILNAFTSNQSSPANSEFQLVNKELVDGSNFDSIFYLTDENGTFITTENGDEGLITSTYKPLLVEGLENVKGAWGWTKLTNNATLCARFERASDQQQLDFGFDINGNFDLDTYLEWKNGTSAFIVTWYDQSRYGNDLTIKGPTSNPSLGTATVNGEIGLVNQSNSSLECLSINGIDLNDTFAITAVFENLNTTGTQYIYSLDGDGSPLMTALRIESDNIYSSVGANTNHVTKEFIRSNEGSIFTTVYDGTLSSNKLKLYEYGELVVTTEGGTIPSSFTVPTTMQLSSQNDLNFFASSSMGALIMYNYPLQSSLKSTIENYYISEYSLTAPPMP